MVNVSGQVTALEAMLILVQTMALYQLLSLKLDSYFLFFFRYISGLDSSSGLKSISYLHQFVSCEERFLLGLKSSWGLRILTISGYHQREASQPNSW